MFNDVLTMEECDALVQRLADCAFPFQCAHGRPSMVPLVGMGGGSDGLGARPMHQEMEENGKLMKDLRMWARKRKGLAS